MPDMNVGDLIKTLEKMDPECAVHTRDNGRINSRAAVSQVVVDPRAYGYKDSMVEGRVLPIIVIVTDPIGSDGRMFKVEPNPVKFIPKPERSGPFRKALKWVLNK